MFEDRTLADTWAEWDTDGMAQCMVLGFGLLEPQDPRADRVWKAVTSKFISGSVPEERIGFFLTLSPLRMTDRTFTDVGYMMMLNNKMKQHWLHEAGFVLHIVHDLNRSRNNF